MKLNSLLIFIILFTIFFSGCSFSKEYDVLILFDNNEITIDDENAADIKNDSIFITKGGTYLLKGSAKGIKIIIDCSDTVKLILNEFSIINTDITPIDIKSGSLVIIESIGKEKNSITTEDNSKNNCIKSHGEILLTGTADLLIKGNDCIESKNKIIIDGNLMITAEGDAVKSDNILISSGNIKITSQKEGIQADNITINSGNIIIDSTGDKSYGVYAKDNLIISNGNLIITTIDNGIYSKDSICINDGNITIQTQNDAFHADNYFEANGGNITVLDCTEGIESSNVVINNGSISIKSENDGINSSNADDAPADIHIRGGEILIDANGDGLDANGSIFIEGGILFVSGAYDGDNNAIDFDDKFVISAGTVIAAGSNSNAKPASIESQQNSVMIIFGNTQPEDICFVIADETKGILMADFMKPYDNIIFSSPYLKSDTKYIYGNAISSELDNSYIVNPDFDIVGIEFKGDFITGSNVNLVWNKN